MVKIQGVMRGSVACENGVMEGDSVISVSGKEVEDLLDLHFHTSKSRCVIRVKRRRGEEFTFKYRQGGKILGLVPEPAVVKRCKNKCIFCFVHQLPPGLRKTLYVKDEDYRLSFLSGNYVTLSDVTDKELKKIIRYRLSPLYISIHTTDNELRRRMLGNPGARDIKELISRLTGAGITLHGQIVLLRDMNDGSLLEETVEELLSYYPHLASLSVVPVGITRHRRNLPILQGYDQVSSRKVVSYVERKAKELRRNLGEDFLYGADEFYIQSGKRVPSGSRYGEFPQLENGVGIVRQFIDGGKAVSRMKGVDLSSISGVVATGRLAGKYVRDFIGKLNEKTGSSIYVLEVRNRLLGDTVSVTGLVPGRDIICDLSGKKAPFLFIPSVMLRESGDRFLDDVTPLMLQSNTGMIVKVFDPHPGDFFRMLRELSLKGLNSQE